MTSTSFGVCKNVRALSKEALRENTFGKWRLLCNLSVMEHLHAEWDERATCASAEKSKTIRPVKYRPQSLTCRDLQDMDGGERRTGFGVLNMVSTASALPKLFALSLCRFAPSSVTISWPPHSPAWQHQDTPWRTWTLRQPHKMPARDTHT
jgi:hypothetical protein